MYFILQGKKVNLIKKFKLKIKTYQQWPFPDL